MRRLETVAVFMSEHGYYLSIYRCGVDNLANPRDPAWN